MLIVFVIDGIVKIDLKIFGFVVIDWVFCDKVFVICEVFLKLVVKILLEEFVCFIVCVNFLIICVVLILRFFIWLK